jgi:tetratricopeptide (TPR) repeat protein
MLSWKIKKMDNPMRNLIMVWSRQSLLVACIVCGFLCACAPSLEQRKKQAEHFRQIGEGYLGEKNLGMALTELHKAEELYEEDPHTQYALGLAYFAKEVYDKALFHFKKAVALQPEYSDALNAAGTVYLKQEKWDEAIPYFEKALTNLLYASPNYSLNNLGDAYRGKKEFDKAIFYYEKALKAMPGYANAYRGIALVHMERGDYMAAVSQLEKAARYAPSSSIIHMDLGTAYAVLYDREKAMEAFNKVIQLVPNSPISDRAFEEIQKLKSQP